MIQCYCPQCMFVHVLYVRLPLRRPCKARFSAFIPWLIYVVTLAIVHNLLTGQEEEQGFCLIQVRMQGCCCRQSMADVQLPFFHHSFIHFFPMTHI